MTDAPATGNTPVDAPLRRAAVLGSGVMGSQIAALLAGCGLFVELLDLPAPAPESNDGGAAPAAAPAPEPGSHERSAPARDGLAAARKLKPDPFFHDEAVTRIRCGNFDDDLQRLSEVDWVIEVVVERLDVKQALLAAVEQVIGEHTLVSSNTSGLPLASLAEGRGESFRRRFLGTHFFNPPRYLPLLELIPTEHTDPDVLARITRFGRLHLGKGVVLAKDTPNFIANRIGTFAALAAMRRVTDGEYTIEEVDALTGTLLGHPKSATFRTADLVGLDVLLNVANHLYEAVPLDESRELFRPPWLLTKLVERDSLGAKTRRGFYAKVGGEILSVDPDSMEYTKARGLKLGDLDELAAVKPLDERLRRLYDDPGRAGAFFRQTTHELLTYSARRLPEIADEVIDVDRAMELGFGWKKGPFALWETLGLRRVLADLRAGNAHLPEWIDALEASGADRFTRREASETASWSVPAARFAARPHPDDELDLASVAADPGKLVWHNDEAALLDLGEGVALFQFRSKMNTLGRAVVEGLTHCIELVEQGPWLGLVIGNDDEHFSVGANLFELGSAAVQGSWKEIEAGVAAFQQMGRRVRYAAKPVVVAPRGRALGGGCEMTMWCTTPVCAAETYLGLVEIGVGLLPAGGGTTLMTALAAERAASSRPAHMAPHLRAAFEQVARAQVATSAHRARQAGFLSPRATLVMNAERLLALAAGRVRHLARQGWCPPPVPAAIPVLGRPGRGPMQVGLQHLVEGGHVDPWLAQVAGRIAWVMTGGDLIAPATRSEQQLLDLEREVFLSLLGEKQTQHRIAEILTARQPRSRRVLAKGLVSLASVFHRKPGKPKKESS